MNGRVTNLNGKPLDVSYKYRYTEQGHLFEYNTVHQLAVLMNSTLIEFSNPYDPINSEYDEFNEKVWELRYPIPN